MVSKIELCGIGIALIILGTALMVSPWICAKIEALPFVKSSLISIMSGTVIFLSLFVVIAGIVITYASITPEKKEEAK